MKRRLTHNQSEKIVQLVLSVQVVLDNIEDIESLGLSVQRTKNHSNKFKKFLESEYSKMIDDIYGVQDNTYQNLIDFRSKVLRKIYDCELQDEIPLSNLVLKYKKQSDRYRGTVELKDYSHRNKELIN